MSTELRPFRAPQPDFAVPPGETLREILEEKGLTQLEVAERSGRPKKTINEIIQGKAAITAETALQLEKVLGLPAEMLLTLESNYRASIARQAERQALSLETPWLKALPIKEMILKGWIRKASDDLEQLQEVLRFLGSASPSAWASVSSQMLTEVAYRQSTVYDSNPTCVALWLRRGEIEALEVRTEPYDADRFLQAVKQIRRLSCSWPFEEELYRLCADSGVVVRFVPELSKVRISGVTRWLNPKRALIQLTLRYKWQDQVWFSFFHEAAHILLHGKRSTFVEPDKASERPHPLPTDQDELKAESEANRFAGDLLIPPSDYNTFVNRGTFTASAIGGFADEIGIAPGIVLGRLQHDGFVPWPTPLNSVLKRKFKWASGS